MAFVLEVEVEGSHPCGGNGSKEVEDVRMRGETSWGRGDPEGSENKVKYS